MCWAYLLLNSRCMCGLSYLRLVLARRKRHQSALMIAVACDRLQRTIFRSTSASSTVPFRSGQCLVSTCSSRSFTSSCLRVPALSELLRSRDWRGRDDSLCGEVGEDFGEDGILR